MCSIWNYRNIAAKEKRILEEMSENAAINDALESNGGPEQPTFNGETEEHISNLTSTDLRE